MSVSQIRSLATVHISHARRWLNRKAGPLSARVLFIPVQMERVLSGRLHHAQQYTHTFCNGGSAMRCTTVMNRCKADAMQ
eukprot:COSAG06_NODE_434_length_15810_cov_9.319521_2_plen_80_part_00